MSQDPHPTEFSFMAAVGSKAVAEVLDFMITVRTRSYHQKDSTAVMVAAIVKALKRHSYLQKCQQVATVMAGYWCCCS